MDVVIRNGIVVTADGLFSADVGIVGERIVALADNLRGEHEIDASGCYVLPGAVDAHVHLQMPLGPYMSADSFESGTCAAACGGTTTVIDFVVPRPGQTFVEALAERRAEADGQVAVDYALHMTIPVWHAARPETLGELSTLVAQGITSFKLYMAYASLCLDDPSLYRVLRAVAHVRGLPIVHCENGPLIELLRAEALVRKETEPIYHARTRPSLQEAEATGRALDLARLAESPLYVVHVSCEESLARIRAARLEQSRPPVFAETCPQYLLFDETALEQERGARYICAPPLRCAPDQRALWEGLQRGWVDVLATDHCPFQTADKVGHPDFTTVPGGLPSIEGRLALAYSFGRQHGLSLQRWVAVCCTNPARLFGLRYKGHLAPGYDADVVIFDPRRCVTLRAGHTLHERVDWSPYEGMNVQGWPRDVLCRGRLIVKNGTFVGERGWGRFVPSCCFGDVHDASSM